jgi:ADP-dependent NAD(P)H-hydrate dehydratase / NAD(P)H-hydrate epimerase
MRAVVGTVPFEDFPLTVGEVTLSGQDLHIGGHTVPVNRGTPALLAAMVRALEVIGNGKVTGFLVGDIGLGKGSRRLYEKLVNDLGGYELESLTFHYLQPDVDWHNRVLFAAEEMPRRPLLIADAGFMYAAKMSGSAAEYDLFTPDAGELAFLADEAAPHPFYTRGFILHDENKVPDLIQRAYSHKNAARHLLVKGEIDRLADRSGVLESVDGPSVDAMEAMGGTGDTLTGLAAALIGSNGLSLPEATIAAAKINREAGALASLTPASQVADLIGQLPKAMEKVLGAIS